MISIMSDLIYKPTDSGKLYNNASEALSLIHNHIIPLNESNNSADKFLYSKAYNSFSYLAEKYDMNGILEPLVDEITNWDFLQTLAFCWKNCGFIDPITRKLNPRDLTARYTLEDVSVRALSKYEVIITTLFRDQTHYSIFGWDIGLLGRSLRDILKSQGRIN